MMSRSSLIRNNLIVLVLLALLAISAALPMLFSQVVTAKANYKQMIIISPSPTISVTTPSILSARTQSNSELDFPLFTVLIGALGTILGSLIGAVASVKVTHHLQEKKEAKSAKEQERQNKEKEIEATKTIEERVQAYRESLRNDPRIVYLQTLEPGRQLKVERIFVRLRLYGETRSNYLLDPDLVAAQDLHDPIQSLEAYRRHFEYQVSKSLDPSKAINEYRHCVIVGDPGAGKTTLLKYLTVNSVDKNLKELPNLPIYIELKAFASSSSNDLLEFLDTRWAEEYGFSIGEAKAYLPRELKNGNVLVLLDGLDETYIGENPSEAEQTYRRVSTAIVQFKAHYQQSPIVVTVRKGMYQEAELDGFIEFEVLDFNLEDIHDFLKKWFAEPPDECWRAEELNKKLKGHPRILALASNPLLLSLITIVYEAHLDLPSNVAKLYEKCVDTLITRWDARRSVRRRHILTSDNIKILLEQIALHFHELGLLFFQEEDLLIFIAGILEIINLSKDQNTQILKEITYANGLLKEQAKGLYGFPHSTFQEYFVACAIANQGSSILLNHIDEPWWEEIIYLSAAYRSDHRSFLQKLLKKYEEIPIKQRIFHKYLILAGRYMAACSFIKETDIQEEIITRLFELLVRTPFSLMRQQIINILAEINRPEANLRLIDFLFDRKIDKILQMLIIDVLSNTIRLPNGISLMSYLHQLLFDSKIDDDIHQRIIFQLGNSEDHSQVARLMELLSENSEDHSQVDGLMEFLSNQAIDVKIRESVVDALGILGAEHLIPRLLDLLEQGPENWYVQTHIVDTLSKIGGSSLASTLRSRLSNNPKLHQQVRIHIINALGTLNDTSGCSELLKLLADPQTDQIERICIVDNLGRLGVGDDSTVRKLRQINSNPEVDRDIQLCAGIVLVKLDKDFFAQGLMQYLSDSTVSIDIRQSISIALTKLNDSTIISSLIVLISTRQIDISLQRSIVDTLGALGNRAFATDLKSLAFDPNLDLDIRGHLVNALVMLREYAIAGEVIRMLKYEDLDIQIRQRIAYNLGDFILDNLGEFKKQLPIGDLLELLSQQQIHENVRKQLANTIGQVAADESTVKTLADLLATSDIKDEIHYALWRVSHRARIRFQ